MPKSPIVKLPFRSRHDHDDHGGLRRDLSQLRRTLGRRQMLGILGASVPLIGCTGSSLLSDAGPLTDTGGASCGSEIPSETGGPYPGDGSNGPNVLALDGVVRSDIRSSFGGLSGTAAGIPLEVTLTLVDAACAPLAGYAIYIWHCDRAGSYSLYSAGVTEQNYLRGVQESDGAGRVTFSTIFPACYSGRWPHMHFEIYPSLVSATTNVNAVKTSQLALPESVCDEVFATSGYEASVGNLAAISLTSDNVFSDGAGQQLATVEGSVSGGYAASLLVPIGL